MTISDDLLAEWTASRMTRLLRPLKAKCLALSNYIDKSSAGSIATYGRRRSSGDQELFTLEAPSNIGFRIYFSRDTVQNLELSQRIYAIRDYYHDLLCRDRSLDNGSTNLSALSPLTSLCSVVLGAQILCKEHFPESDVTPEEFLYQTIPPLYRFRVLAMHALHIILEYCPPNASLYLSLLDVTLERRFYHESEVLLDTILDYAFESSQDSSPRISNPACRRFLVDLYSNWKLQFPTSTFVRLVTSALQRALSDDVWTSKATRRLARKLVRYDTNLLPTLLIGLVETIFKRKEASKLTTHLEAQLQEWFQLCVEISMYSLWKIAETSIPLADQDPLSDMIEHYHSWLIQLRVDGRWNDLVAHTLTDAFVCLYALWLTSGPRRIDIDDVLRTQLQHYVPSSSTFTPICNLILRSASLSECEDILRTISSTFITHNIPRLRASLWACALHHVDQAEIEQIHMDESGRRSIRDFRLRLVDHVDQAERDCFAVIPRSGPSSAREVFNDGDKRAGEGHIYHSSHSSWSWEATFGCWFRRSAHSQEDAPATPKRRKISERLSPSRPPSQVLRRTSLSRAGVPADEQGVFCSSPSSDSSDQSSIDGIRQAPVQFFSLLSTALLGRASLRGEHWSPRRKNHDDEKNSILAKLTDLENRDDTCHIDDDEAVSDRNTNHAFSEDHLDLFRIAGTSPVQIK